MNLGSHKGSCPVIIVGGGPVGLLLGIILSKAGINCRILEKRSRISPHSRSIGIHPVSLEILEESGMAEKFLDKGLKIRRGHAYTDDKLIGTLSFSECPRPYNYILAIPQSQTEKILMQELHRINPDCLLMDAHVQTVLPGKSKVDIIYTRNGDQSKITGHWLVGCDGKNSIVRRSAEIPFSGKKYPDYYLMGDYTDTTLFGSDAAIFLHRQGLIESFPLPGRKRRWVVKSDRFIESPQEKVLRRIISNRLDMNFSCAENSMISSFGVEHYLADIFYRDRCILAGDAAHIVSPIGGQGMNLGWMTAHNLGRILTRIITSPRNSTSLLNLFSSESRQRARQTARRAEINMWLGRQRHTTLIRDLLVRMIVRSPAKFFMARVFTMRGLGTWPV